MAHLLNKILKEMSPPHACYPKTSQDVWPRQQNLAQIRQTGDTCSNQQYQQSSMSVTLPHSSFILSLLAPPPILYIKKRYIKERKKIRKEQSGQGIQDVCKEFLRKKKNLQVKIEEWDRRDIAPAIQHLLFFTVCNYGNYSNVLKNSWEKDSVHLHQWQCFKDFKSPR